MVLNLNYSAVVGIIVDSPCAIRELLDKLTLTKNHTSCHFIFLDQDLSSFLYQLEVAIRLITNCNLWFAV